MKKKLTKEELRHLWDSGQYDSYWRNVFSDMQYAVHIEVLKQSGIIRDGEHYKNAK